MSDPLRNLRALRAKVDHHSHGVMARHPGRFACRAGCDGCCQTERSVSAVELAGARSALAALDPGLRERLGKGPGCSMLLEGACAIYADRPLICRSHGLPITMEGRRDTCPLNFEGVDLETLPDADVLSVEAVTAILVAVNMLYCQEEGGDPAERTELRALLG